VVAENMQLLGGRDGAGAPGGDEGGYSSEAPAPRPAARPATPRPAAPMAAPRPAPSAAAKAPTSFDDMDDDIPF